MELRITIFAEMQTGPRLVRRKFGAIQQTPMIDGDSVTSLSVKVLFELNNPKIESILTPWFPPFQPLRRGCAKLRDFRLSWIVSNGRAAVFIIY